MRKPGRRTLLALSVGVGLAFLAGARARSAAPPEEADLTVAEEIAEGRRLFMEETFGGNGRTCVTCHVAALNFRLTPANIADRFRTPRGAALGQGQSHPSEQRNESTRASLEPGQLSPTLGITVAGGGGNDSNIRIVLLSEQPL